MTKRIFYSIFVVALAVFLASVLLIMGLLYSYFSQVQRQQLRTQTELAAQAVSHEGVTYFDDLELEGCRVTWIDANGVVLYDNRSESAGMENHLQREEIREALESGTGESVRNSKTLLERSLYCARKLPDGTVIRLSIAQSSVLNLLLGVAQPICVVFAVALVLSVLLAYRLSRKIVKPLNELDLEKPVGNGIYQELEPLVNRIDAQQRELRLHARALARKETEFIAVTENLSEGLVLLGKNCEILSMNPAARRLLKLRRSSVGTNILTYDKALADLLLQALEGYRAEKILPLAGGQYQVDAGPVITEEAVSGVVLLLFDVTQKLQAEQMRREFTANVSHELKTPLQSISGYAELISSGMARPEDVGRFSGQIHEDSQRMIRLVEDILRLSRLDEGAGEMGYGAVELYSVTRRILDGLHQKAEQMNVTVTLEGAPVELRGIPELVEGIVSNLCSNAIKYNRRGGSVKVRIVKEAEAVLLEVADTGIGIEPEHQERIFERFYRVDKSHSRQVGGTGLGLSIVKRSVLALGGSVEMQSTPGVGSIFTVRFCI